MQNTCTRSQEELRVTKRWLAHNGYADRFLVATDAVLSLGVAYFWSESVVGIGEELITRTEQPTVSTMVCPAKRDTDNLSMPCAPEQALVVAAVSVTLITAMGVGVLTRAAGACFQQMRARETYLQPRIERMEGELEARRMVETSWGI